MGEAEGLLSVNERLREEVLPNASEAEIAKA
jgi:hypothetical protein